MFATLLQSKLHKPVVQNRLISRPHLLARLNAGLNRPLTLVCAPAGYGKTTLVAEWGAQLARSQRSLCWVSLDEYDNDPVQFFTYLIAALQQVNPALGDIALEQLRTAPDNTSHTALITLVNDLAASSQEVILALDDYHVITNAAIHKNITFLIHHAPPPFHLVLITRADPPVSLARLRARQQMTEIRQHDLRFAVDEAHDLFSHLQLQNLSELAVAALTKRTEGWVAGLQMAALSLQGRSELDGFIADFAGSHRYIFDYLVEEVLSQRPPGTRDFLLQTAVLNRMSASLCDAVRQSDGSQAILEQLEATNLFVIPLDNSRRWYRYHHLFADLLRQHLQRERPQQESVLHDRASRWFEQVNLWDEAVHHALAANNFDRAAHLVADYSETLLMHGEVSAALSLINRLPQAWRRRQPKLILNHAWALLFRSDVHEVEAALAHLPPEVAVTLPFASYVQVLRSTMAMRQGHVAQAIALSEQAEAQLSQLDPQPAVLSARVVANVNLINGYWLQGKLSRVHEVYETALALNQNAGNLLAQLQAMRVWGTLLIEQGQLYQAEAIFQQGLHLAKNWVSPFDHLERHLAASAPLHISLGKLYYEWNLLPKAETHLTAAAELFVVSGQVNMSEGVVALAQLRLAQGRHSAAQQLLAELETVRKTPGSQFARLRLAIASAVIQCALYARLPSPILQAALGQLLPQLQTEQADVVLARARVLLVLNQREEAQRLLETLASRMAESSLEGTFLQTAILLIQLHYQSGETKAALAWLARALPIAAKGGYVRLFLDAGEWGAGLLQMTGQPEIHADHAARLLSQMNPPPPASQAARTMKQPAAHPVLDLLSPRETEVLRLIAQGLTNKEIAAQLVITPSTAKRHTINIYNKLDVNNRTEATARAYEAGLMADL